ncbi:hypothetical protein BGZ65_004257 [Modicella reniformis]|uniref:Carboxylesterase type B domain-containing protein n=1 Tax=Modicella reniformis TaxID=1440133 RepID=A0A9P6STI0_9FUNG|nr:hypothetical protein BGZ65_004257 [Modicella reniformis]
MRSKSVADILDAKNTIGQAINMSPQESFLELIIHSIDGVLIFDNYDQLVAGKNEGIHNAHLMIGTMKDESIGFLPSMVLSTPMPPQIFGLMLDIILGYQRSMVIIGSGLYTIDGSNPDGVHEAEGRFGADHIWDCPTQYIAKAYAATSAPVYQYQFQKVITSTAPWMTFATTTSATVTMSQLSLKVSLS